MLRHTFDRIVIRSGASVKEAQPLMRHSDPKLRMNVYAKAGLYTVAGVMNRITLQASSLHHAAPLMHQDGGILGYCTVQSGTTGAAEIRDGKCAKEAGK